MIKAPFFERSELTAALWAFRREFVMVGVCSGIANLMMLAPTMYMLQVFDRVMQSRSELTLLAVSLVTLFLFFVLAFSEWTRSRVLVFAGRRFDERLSTRVFNASFESYLTQTRASPTRAFSDLIALRQFITGQGIFALFDAPWSPIYIGVTFLLHPFLGWVTLSFVLAQGALAWFVHRKTVMPAQDAAKAGADVNAFVQSKLRNAEVIESMGMLDNLRQRWRRWQGLYLAHNTQAHKVSSSVVAASKFMRYSQQAIALTAGALLVIDGQLTPGGMIAANLLMSRALAPIDQLVSVWRSFVSVREAFRRLEQLLADHPQRLAAVTGSMPKGDITLRDVVATAPGREAPILDGLSFSVPAGTVTAVLGPSGSGKSTLARVMMGIWPTVTGEVLLDGQPIQGWDRIELGPHLGYLPQEIELFEGTIAENIARFGVLDSDKVIAAARCVGLHQMILRFPKGYDTAIGEAGTLLSGGQRQRIGIARAVYGDPSLLVLDEPNANLDEAGEAAFLEAVLQLKAKGKTVFLISHRTSAVTVADRILILQDGRLVSDGSREAVFDGARVRPPPLAPRAQAASSAQTV